MRGVAEVLSVVYLACPQSRDYTLPFIFFRATAAQSGRPPHRSSCPYYTLLMHFCMTVNDCLPGVYSAELEEYATEELGELRSLAENAGVENQVVTNRLKYVTHTTIAEYGRRVWCWTVTHCCNR